MRLGVSRRVRHTQTDVLLAAIGEVRGCAHTKRRVMDVITSFVGFRFYVPHSLVRTRRIKQAALMLRNGMRRSEAARVLRDRYGISESTAYRFLAAALKVNRRNHV